MPENDNEATDPVLRETEGETYEQGRYAMAWGPVGEEDRDTAALVAVNAMEMIAEVRSIGDEPGVIVVVCHAPQLEDLAVRIRDLIDRPEALDEEPTCEECGIGMSFVPDSGCGERMCPHNELRSGEATLPEPPPKTREEHPRSEDDTQRRTGW